MGSQQQIIDEIKTYINRGSGKYQDWFICLETASQQTAMVVTDYFVNALGTDGNLCEDNSGRPCQFLYIYKKAVHPAGYKTRELVQSVSRGCVEQSWLRAIGNKMMRYLYAS